MEVTGDGEENSNNDLNYPEQVSGAFNQINDKSSFINDELVDLFAPNRDPEASSEMRNHNSDNGSPSSSLTTDARSHADLLAHVMMVQQLKKLNYS